MKFGPAAAVDLSPEQVAGLIFEHKNRLRNARFLATVGDYDMSVPSAIRIEDHDWRVADRLHRQEDKKEIDHGVLRQKKTGAILGDEAERVVLTLGSEKRSRKIRRNSRVLFSGITRTCRASNWE